jgi:predicted transcriptional regulator
MSDISKRELSNLLNSEYLGEKAYFLAATGSWLNLRILDILFKNDRATAGEIARSINVGMSEVTGGLEELQTIGIVSSEKDEERNAVYWYPIVSEITIKISDRSELFIDNSLEKRRPQGHNESAGRNGPGEPDRHSQAPYRDLTSRYKNKIEKSINNILKKL